MPTIQATITENGQTHTVPSDVQITADALTATAGTRTLSVPLARIREHWADQPTAPLTLSFLPHVTLAPAVNTLLKTAWVAGQDAACQDTLRQELEATPLPGAALIRKLWAAQGSVPIQKRPRADLLAAALAARGWTLYRGAVYRIETLGDITSQDVVAIFTPATGTLSMYQTEETWTPEYPCVPVSPRAPGLPAPASA